MNQPPSPSRLRGELWDNMHYLFRDVNDRMVHASFTYGFHIDPDVFLRTMDHILECVPVFHASFEVGFFRSHWKVHPRDVHKTVTFQEIADADLEEQQERFLADYIAPSEPQQLRIRVFYHGEKSTICLLVSHMCMDAGSLKYFLACLCRIYGQISRGETPEKIKMGDRAYTAVYECFSPEKRKGALRQLKNINEKDDSFFPLTPEAEGDRIMIIRRKLPAGMLPEMRAAAKRVGATINDLILTAYFESLYDLAGYARDRGLSISCAIDLRRHLSGPAKESITNHTAWMQCRTPGKGSTPAETLDAVRESVAGFKADPYMGLHGLPLIGTIYNVLPHAIAEFGIKVVYDNPPTSLSNIGQLDDASLRLLGNPPVDGFITGAVKYKPYVLLSACSLGDDLTIGMCIRGNEEDRAIVERFFDIFIKNTRLLVEDVENRAVS